MKYQVSMNIGFVTNSSSAIYHFPVEAFQDERIQTLLKKFEFCETVSDEPWHRGLCETIAWTKEAKREFKNRVNRSEYSEFSYAPNVNDEDDSILIVFGDEYESIASMLADYMIEFCEKNNLEYKRSEYN